MRLIEVQEKVTYRRHEIARELWIVNGQPRTVYTVDGAHAPDGHFDTLEDAQRACRRRGADPAGRMPSPN